MLLAGDELGRTQNGNNNAYCQDSELTWIDWNPTDLGQRLHAFVRRLIRLRMAHPIFRRRRFFEGCEIGDSGAKDILWLKPDGEEMDTESWNAPGTRAIGALLNGLGLGEMDRRGHQLDDDNFLLFLNAGSEDVDFHLTAFPGRGRWDRVLDTSLQEGSRTGDHYQAGDACPVQARSVTVLRQHRQMGNDNGDGQ
jgi:isoamylase